MKQILLKKGKVCVEDVPAPICGPNEILVANSASLISAGTESASIKNRSESLIKLAMRRPDLRKKVMATMKTAGIGKTMEMVKSKISAPTPLGYSCAGTVMEVGKSVRGFSPGDRVACAGAGYATHSEFVSVPKNLAAKIPDGVTFEEAAFTTIGSIAMQGVRRSGASVGETVVVSGLGLIGIITAQILRAAGCRTIGLDINESRVKLARKLGLEKGIVVTREDPVKAVENLTGGAGADSVIITAATPSSEPVRQAIKMCRKRGRVVVVGDVGMDIPRSPFYEKELDFVISCSYGPGRYDPEYEEKGADYPLGYVRWTENRNMQSFLMLLKNKSINVSPLVSKTFRIEDAQTAYTSLSGGNMITGLFKYGSPRKNPKRTAEVSPKPRVPGKIRVGLIGVGSYAKSFHLPNLNKIKDYDIYAVATRTPANAKVVAERYGAKYYTTDYRKIIKDEKVDLVLISTRHNLHAQIAVEAARAGKDVFVEKPMAMNEKEMAAVSSAVRKHRINYMVGFNRRFSPFVTKIKETFGMGSGPWIINYVVNAGKLPRDHWLYDPEEGGGRIIGECCHFFDLFNYLIGSDVKEISVIPVSGRGETLSEDNFSAAIKYSDGSVANLIYNSIGNKAMPKESIDVFRAGLAARVEDFRELRMFGCGGSSRGTQDKGQYWQMLEFSKAIQGQPSQKLTLEELERATLTSFEVSKRVRK